MKMFQTGKVGLFLDSITHRLEKRKGDEVKVIALTLRAQPFTHQLATAVDDIVRGALFKRSGNADPHVYVKALHFSLPVPRQNIDVYASPDTEAGSIRFEQVRVSDIKARTEKGTDGYGFTFIATFGPVSRNELEFCEGWRLNQKFLSFEEAEPSLDFADEESGDEDDAPTSQGQGAPMFGDDPPAPSVGAAAAKPDRANRRMHSHAGGKNGKKK